MAKKRERVLPTETAESRSCKKHLFKEEKK